MKSNFKIAFFAAAAFDAAFDAALTITFDCFPAPLNFGSTRKKRYLKMQEFFRVKPASKNLLLLFVIEEPKRGDCCLTIDWWLLLPLFIIIYSRLF